MVKTKTASAFFSRYASNFDAIYGTRKTLLNRFVNRYFRKSMRLRFEKTMEGCNPIQKRSVLDIGCGPGHYAISLAMRGASPVVGLDFAEGMLELARKHSEEAGVANQCEFIFGDFDDFSIEKKYDYAIVMGFMDYVAEPLPTIDKVLSITERRAFFSFPTNRGFLAWQRRLRYSLRCPLFLYGEEQVRELLQYRTDCQISIERIARDLFVTVSMD